MGFGRDESIEERPVLLCIALHVGALFIRELAAVGDEWLTPVCNEPWRAEPQQHQGPHGQHERQERGPCSIREQDCADRGPGDAHRDKHDQHRDDTESPAALARDIDHLLFHECCRLPFQQLPAGYADAVERAKNRIGGDPCLMWQYDDRHERLPGADQASCPMDA